MRRPVFLVPALLCALLALLAPGPATADDADAALLGNLPGLGTALGEPSGTTTEDADDPDAEHEPRPDPTATPTTTPEPARTPTPGPNPTPTPTTPPTSEDTVPDVELPADPASGDDGSTASVELRSVVRVHYVDVEPGDPDPDGTCPDASTCEIYEVGQARWPTDTDGAFRVGYRYNDSGRPADRAPSAGAVQSMTRFSAREWMRRNPNVNIVEAGTTDASYGQRGEDGSCADGVNVVGWEALGSGVAGVTKVCFDPETYVIRDIDMALNSQLHWGNLTSAETVGREFDVRAVLTHEFGHWLSLFDLRTPEAEAQTMYASSRPGEVRKRTLALGDVLGSRAAYPCGPEDRCSRTGIIDD